MITYQQFQIQLSGIVKDSVYVSNNQSRILYATNQALNDINNGEIGEPNTNLTVGYNWQKNSTPIVYVPATLVYPITVTNFKFSYALTAPASSGVIFEEVDENYFWRKQQAFTSRERMYYWDYDNNVLNVNINYTRADTLTLKYFSTDMVLNQDGVTYQAEVVNNNDSFLIPDSWMNVLLELVAAKVYYQTKGLNSSDFKEHLLTGQTGLKRMISAIGTYRKKGISRPMIHSEFYPPLSRRM